MKKVTFLGLLLVVSTVSGCGFVRNVFRGESCSTCRFAPPSVSSGAGCSTCPGATTSGYGNYDGEMISDTADYYGGEVINGGYYGNVVPGSERVIENTPSMTPVPAS